MVALVSLPALLPLAGCAATGGHRLTRTDDPPTGSGAADHLTSLQSGLVNVTAQFETLAGLLHDVQGDVAAVKGDVAAVKLSVSKTSTNSNTVGVVVLGVVLCVFIAAVLGAVLYGFVFRPMNWRRPVPGPTSVIGGTV